VLVDTDTAGDTILGQLYIYCEKRTSYQGLEKYEKAWSNAKASMTDANAKTWVDNLKSTTEGASYNCIPSSVQFKN